MIAVARAAQECSTNLDGWQAVAIVVVVSSALVLLHAVAAWVEKLADQWGGDGGLRPPFAAALRAALNGGDDA